jgi:hypothetical protein
MPGVLAVNTCGDGNVVSKMLSAVSKAYLFRAPKLFAPRKETDGGTGESVFFPQPIFQISKV